MNHECLNQISEQCSEVKRHVKYTYRHVEYNSKQEAFSKMLSDRYVFLNEQTSEFLVHFAAGITEILNKYLEME